MKFEPQVSLLHISDLHREHDSEISTSVLLSSLKLVIDDLGKISPSIRRPDLTVVSGDVVRGAINGHPDPVAEVARQYEQSKEFLSQLVDWLHSGNRSHLVMIPGNHDVEFCTSKECVVEKSLPAATKETHRELRKELRKYDSSIRFCWDSLRYFEIKDKDKYSRRLEQFATFYKDFYASIGREYSLDPAEQYAVFDYPTLSLTILALNSCYHNDHLNKQGKINPECIAAAYEEMRNPQYSQRLRVAMWHHNLVGSPLDDDYLDPRFIQNLINSDFSIGLHGHQHKNEYVTRSYEFNPESFMTVVSAGSLCAGRWAMPLGQTRSFNIIEIDYRRSRGRLNTFRMLNDDLLNPIWGPGLIRQSNSSSIDFALSKTNLSKPEDFDRRVNEALDLMSCGKLDEAINLLLTVDNDAPSRRELLINCLIEKSDRSNDDSCILIELLTPPQSPAEIIQLIETLQDTGQKDMLITLLTSLEVTNSTDPAVMNLRNVTLERINNEQRR